MCIRDRLWDGPPDPLTQYVDVSSVVVVDDGVVDDFDPADPVKLVPVEVIDSVTGETVTCLLYTSDAADERSSVDLGGRRIIKNKNKKQKKKKMTNTQKNRLTRYHKLYAESDSTTKRPLTT